MNEYLAKKCNDALTEKAYGLEIIDYDLYLMQMKKKTFKESALIIGLMIVYGFIGFVMGVAYCITYWG